MLLPEVNVTAAEENTSLQDEEDEENMLALQILMRGKNPPAQTVQGLLIATRASREKWLQTASISIKDILKKYTALRMSKWVRVYRVHGKSMYRRTCGVCVYVYTGRMPIYMTHVYHCLL